MSHSFLFICPVCHAEDSIAKNRCNHCKTAFIINAESIVYSEMEVSYPEMLRRMRDLLPHRNSLKIPDLFTATLPPEEIVLRVSKSAVLRQGNTVQIFNGFENIFSRKLLQPDVLSKGVVCFSDAAFYFLSENQQCQRFPYSDMQCVTTNSGYLEFKIRGQKFFQIKFLQESPLKYEMLFQKILQKFYSDMGTSVLEFQPAVRLCVPKSIHSRPCNLKMESVRETRFNRLVVSFLLSCIRAACSLFIRVKIKSKSNIPANFPFIALANHYSTFDPFIILAYLDRRIAFLTKSTSFFSFIEKNALKIGRGIPTTRYQNDVAVHFHIRKFLQKGIPVGIFPEGERSWDGALSAFKYSVIKTLQFNRSPVLPIVLKGAFQFMPRWAKLPKKANITIEVLPPFSLVPEYFSIEEQKSFVESLFRDKLSAENNQK